MSLYHTQLDKCTLDRGVCESDQLVAEVATHTNTANKEKNIHAFNGIRTRDSSNQAAADLGLTPHGQRIERLILYLSEIPSSRNIS
jgi:hypothetical protein